MARTESFVGVGLGRLGCFKPRSQFTQTEALITTDLPGTSGRRLIQPLFPAALSPQVSSSILITVSTIYMQICDSSLDLFG